MNANVWIMTLVIALEPIPILAGVLLLTAERGRPKAIAFAIGWAFALGVVAVATALIGEDVSTPSGSTSSKASAVLDILLGLAAIVVAIRTRAKARAGTDPGTPKWMQTLDTMKPRAAFLLGCFLPPYVIAAAVSNQIIRLDLTTQERVVAVILFAVVGSLGVLIPILVTVVRPNRSEAILTSWRAWLQGNWHAVLFWMLLGIGGYLVVKGIIELGH
jgi:Sap, sulfolipid-1-addressing protein